MNPKNLAKKLSMKAFVKAISEGNLDRIMDFYKSSKFKKIHKMAEEILMFNKRITPNKRIQAILDRKEKIENMKKIGEKNEEMEV